MILESINSLSRLSSPLSPLPLLTHSSVASKTDAPDKFFIDDCIHYTNAHTNDLHSSP